MSTPQQVLTSGHTQVYISEVPAEDVERYAPGGYHPVLLKDRLNDGRYEILHKLGFGSFGTVWLAKDVVRNRNVTIKIVVGSQSDEHHCRELLILQHLQLSTATLQHPGRKYVPVLLDSFYLDGPNGHHLCLVLDVVGPTANFIQEKYKDYRLPGKLAQRVSRQVLLAVDYLHQSGVVHGDIHMGNILFCYPNLDNLTPQEITSVLGEPVTGLVARTDGTSLPPNAPTYVVEPTEYTRQFPEFSEIQLIDFGEAFLTGDPPQTLNTPASLHPPELIFRQPLTDAVDVWNLGCTVFELVMSRLLFWVSTDDQLLSPFQKVLGEIPGHWIAEALEKGFLTKSQFEGDGDDAAWTPLEEEVIEAYGTVAPDDSKCDMFQKRDLDILARCLRKMLVLDPKCRATTHALLGEEWFVRGEVLQLEQDRQDRDKI